MSVSDIVQHTGVINDDYTEGPNGLFRLMKKILDGQKFACDTEVQSAVRQWLRQQPTSFFTFRKLLMG